MGHQQIFSTVMGNKQSPPPLWKCIYLKLIQGFSNLVRVRQSRKVSSKVTALLMQNSLFAVPSLHHSTTWNWQILNVSVQLLENKKHNILSHASPNVMLQSGWKSKRKVGTHCWSRPHIHTALLLFFFLENKHLFFQMFPMRREHKRLPRVKALHQASFFRVFCLFCAAASNWIYSIWPFQKDAGVVTVALCQATNYTVYWGGTNHPSPW